jgi:hypothetical protein
MHNTKTATDNSAAITRFMDSQFKHLMPINNVRTTPREQGMMQRYMETCSAMLGPTSKALLKGVLGPLDPKQWTPGLMVPIKQPPTDAKAQQKALKKDLNCRQALLSMIY